MKKILYAILFLISSAFINVNACTSFAVYSNDTTIYYGMNFDYPDVEFRLSVAHYDTIIMFHMSFYNNGYYASTVGMNSNGFFSSCQMLYPEEYATHAPGNDEITTGEFYYQCLTMNDNTNNIIDFFDTSDVNLIHYTYISLHNIFADKYGNAIVLEAGDSAPYITFPDDNFLVMSNFPNHAFAGEPYTNITGVGADRYIAAYEYILDHKDGFRYDDALETLQRTMQTSGGYRTQCSFVFDPVNLDIYVVIRRNFNRIWKVDLENEIIETYSGFGFYNSFLLNGNGVLASTLELINSITDQDGSNIRTFAKLYPNPFYSNIYINHDPVVELKYKIFDMLGKIVCSGSLNKEGKIWLEFLEDGIYWIELYNKNKIYYIDKIIKTRNYK